MANVKHDVYSTGQNNDAEESTFPLNEDFLKQNVDLFISITKAD